MSPHKDTRGKTKDRRLDKQSEKNKHAEDSSPDIPRSLTLKEKNVLEFLERFIREKGISPSYQEISQNFGFASLNSVQRYLKQLEGKGYIRSPGGNQKRALTILRSASALQDAIEDIQRDSHLDDRMDSHMDNRTDHLANVRANVRNVVPVGRAFQNHLQNEVFNLPLLGRVAAGAPIEAYEHDEYIDVPASLVRHAERTYALRVQGQSMIEDGILDGDVILVQRQAYASNGEIVVAMIGEEATVKRFYTHKGDPRGELDAGSNQNLERDLEMEVFNEIAERAQRLIELRPANSNMQSLWFSPEEVQIRGIVVGLIRKF